MVADLVLIHGSTQSPAKFGPLVAALADRGHRAFTPWIRGEPTASAVEHAEVPAAQLPADLVAPVVLAHSAAGLLLPAVARGLDAVHQIWLAAAVADYPNRRSLLTELQADPQAIVNPEWLDVDPTTDPVVATYFSCSMMPARPRCATVWQPCTSPTCPVSMLRFSPPTRPGSRAVQRYRSAPPNGQPARPESQR